MSHLTCTWTEFKNWIDKNYILTTNKKILDIGCKNHDSKEFFEKLGMVWTGIDKQPESKRNIDNNLFKMDMTKLDFNDESFDFIFVCHSLEHCENPLQALKEFYRVLVKNSWLFISLPCYCENHIVESDEDHIFVLTDIQLLRLLKYCKFDNYNECFKGQPIDSAPHQYNLIGIARK